MDHLLLKKKKKQGTPEPSYRIFGSKIIYAVLNLTYLL